MSVATRYLRRDPAEVQPWAETCGQIRPLIEAADGAAAEVHHVEIDHAKLHYHQQTDEVYYIIDGAGHHDPRRRGNRSRTGASSSTCRGA